LRPLSLDHRCRCPSWKRTSHWHQANGPRTSLSPFLDFTHLTNRASANPGRRLHGAHTHEGVDGCAEGPGRDAPPRKRTTRRSRNYCACTTTAFFRFRKSPSSAMSSSTFPDIDVSRQLLFSHPPCRTQGTTKMGKRDPDG